MNVVKSAPECENLGDIRQGIDDLDRQIVQILARRLTYVKAATRFKASQQAIPAPDRVRAMLEERRQWANDAGLPVDETEDFFKDLIHWFINQQITHWRALHPEAQP